MNKLVFANKTTHEWYCDDLPETLEEARKLVNEKNDFGKLWIADEFFGVFFPPEAIVARRNMIAELQGWNKHQWDTLPASQKRDCIDAYSEAYGLPLEQVFDIFEQCGLE